MDDFAGPGHEASHESKLQGMMNTDVKEADQKYEIEISLPGIEKDNIRMQLKDGYLTIAARTSDEKENKSEDGKYIRRERFSGKMMRTFYVGENVRESDIHPKYENGILSFEIPKENQVVEEKHHYITIE